MTPQRIIPRVFSAIILTSSFVACGSDPGNGEASVADVGMASDTGESESDGSARDDAGDEEDSSSSADVVGESDACCDEDTWNESVLRATGWYGTTFEHVAFVSLQYGVPEGITTCSPYAVQADLEETWWMLYADESSSGLVVYPGRPGESFERMGLIDVIGTLSPAGQFGHMGGYGREFSAQTTSLRVCESVEAIPHCLVPESEQLCAFGTSEDGSLRHELTRILPGPEGSTSLELRVVHGEDIADGRTDWRIVLAEPHQEGRVALDLEDLVVHTAREERYGFFYEEVDVEVTDGWVIFDRERDAIQYSLSVAAPDGQTRYLWGDVVVGETIAMP